MRKTFQVLAFVLAAEVLVQAMAIAYALAGVGKWVDDGHTLTKAVIEDHDSHVGGDVGFMIHGLNGQMVIPVLVLALLVVSLFAKIPGGTKRAGILVGLVVLQVSLGIFSHVLPAAILLHALNAFAIFTLAAMTGVRLRTGGDLVAARAATGAAAV